MVRRVWKMRREISIFIFNSERTGVVEMKVRKNDMIDVVCRQTQPRKFLIDGRDVVDAVDELEFFAVFVSDTGLDENFIITPDRKHA